VISGDALVLRDAALLSMRAEVALFLVITGLVPVISIRSALHS
jgi:hypothetical protein